MKKTESYYLLPGTSIGKKGLPNGKLECKKSGKPLKVDPKYYGICGDSFDYLIAKGKMVDGAGLKKMEEKAEKEKADAKAKAEADKKADAEAAEAQKKDDSEAAKELEALKKQAAELNLDAKKDATAEELKALIDAELNK